MKYRIEQPVAAAPPTRHLISLLLLLLLLMLPSTAGAMTLPSPSAAHYVTDISTGYDSCQRAIATYGHRGLVHGPGSVLNRAMAVRTCELAVEVAYKEGLRGDVVRYITPAWGIQESNWAAAAVGDNTELGPLQIKANTCRAVQADACVAKDGVVIHLRASLRYLDQMRGYGNGSWTEALSAYRVGPGGWRGVTDCMRGNKVCEPIDEIRRVQGQEYASAIQNRADFLD